ncbi:MAG: hypothetical protein V7K67_18245 [Nostoc sp.]
MLNSAIVESIQEWGDEGDEGAGEKLQLVFPSPQSPVPNPQSLLLQ